MGPGQRVFLVDNTSGTVGYLDPATSATLRPVATVQGATGLAVGADGQLYVTATDFATGTGRLVVLDADGTVRTTTVLDGPSAGAALGPDGRVYVASFRPIDGGTLKVFTAVGAVVDTVPLTGTPYGVAVGANGVAYATDLNAARVVVSNPDGTTESIPVGNQPFGSPPAPTDASTCPTTPTTRSP